MVYDVANISEATKKRTAYIVNQKYVGSYGTYYVKGLISIRIFITANDNEDKDL